MKTKKTLNFSDMLDQYQSVAAVPAKIRQMPDDEEDSPGIVVMWDTNHPMAAYYLDEPMTKYVIPSAEIVGSEDDAQIEASMLTTGVFAPMRPTSITKTKEGLILFMTLDRVADIAVRPLTVEDSQWVKGGPSKSIQELINYIAEQDTL
jgi:hypothetical protein